MSRLTRRTCDPHLRQTLRNTLDWILPPTGTVTLFLSQRTGSFSESALAENERTAAWSVAHVNGQPAIGLVGDSISDGQFPLADDKDAFVMVTKIMHEVAHLANKSFGSAFLEAYTAYRVAVRALLGRELTRKESYGLAVWMLQADTYPEFVATLNETYDSVCGCTVLFGGFGSGYLNDVWQWTAAAAAQAQRFVPADDKKLGFQVRPSGTSGSVSKQAEVALDFLEVRVMYQP